MGSYRFAAALLGGALAVSFIPGAQASTLDEVKQRGVLHCGVAPNIPGFAFTDDQGVKRGFDIDMCHALAAAVLGDAKKIEVTPLGLRDAFAALTTGAQDILTHRLTWTYNRDNGGGMRQGLVTADRAVEPAQ